jgi:hypothetical protein
VVGAPRVSGDAVEMVEAASRQNKGAGARSPSRQGHVWRCRRAAGLVSSQIDGSGEGGLSGQGRLSTLPWSFGSRRAVVRAFFPSAGRGGEGGEGDDTIAFLVRVFRVVFLRCDCRVVKLPPAGHGGEGRRWLDVASMVGTYCSGSVDWRFCLVSTSSRLPDGLEKITSSHPSGWALLRCSKPNVAKVAAVTRWCLKTGGFRIRSLYLGGDDEDDGLDCDLGVRCVVFWVHIVFSFFVESFVIGFAID